MYACVSVGPRETSPDYYLVAQLLFCLVRSKVLPYLRRTQRGKERAEEMNTRLP